MVTAVHRLLKRAVTKYARMSAIHSCTERCKIRKRYSKSCPMFSGKYELSLFDFNISVKILGTCVVCELYMWP
jgi:hypothetical protein